MGADGNKNFRNAFLKLYGLDTLSIMIENFNRNAKRADSKKHHMILISLPKRWLRDKQVLLILLNLI